MIGVSVLGVDNGFTSYIVSGVESFEAVGNSFGTATILTTPETVTCKHRTAHLSFCISNRFFFCHAVTIGENDSIYSGLGIATSTIDGEVIVGNAVVQCMANPSGGDMNCVEILSISGTGLPAGGVASTIQYLATTTPIFTITDSASTPTATNPGGVVSQTSIKPNSGSS